MAKLRINNGKKNGIVNLKVVVKTMLQKSLSLGRKSNNSYEDVPEDVKEGHFAVIAVDHSEGQTTKRFVVPLSYLTHPRFIRLLEQAAEEYGFDREGVLTIPCSPTELERILAEQWQEEGDHSCVDVTL